MAAVTDPMAFAPSPARLPPRRDGAPDPRLLDLFVDAPAAADVLLCGIPFDEAVIGRKGARGGPTAIREALRYVATWDPDARVDLASLRLHDLGDVAGLPEEDVLAAHAAAKRALRPAFAHRKPLVVLGGDNSLSFPVLDALSAETSGPIGLVVLDAHYDVRPWEGQPTSGTPYRRVLEELDGRVRGPNLAEVGIRPLANTKVLADYAASKGIQVHTVGEVRRRGMARVARQALKEAGKGTEHLWLSVDIDGLDQAIAPGCSAPGPGGLTFDEAATLVRTVAADPRVRGMDLVEVAPNLDVGGMTARTAAQLVGEFAVGLR
ncbi:MAG: formiminoglutamase [Thermoplasmata archaeon]|jgi:formimidoylglutamase|nr:formiminoglutamase [Thermoplasmata archaeon]